MMGDGWRMADGGWRMADDGLVIHHNNKKKQRRGRNVLCLYPYAFNGP